ncbi:hypothetical protein EUGRSUZ_C00390 [Eucalyptus grandis]|uniref:Uncharacterized protein n=2 Tax=Eucalyptus grandis TaxID=71139 RepID=A0ACC3LAA6_EUCGR|nr:hypothetical protein EUGRSUZ_C00390 [Eucalyptus grandis]
MLDAESRKSGKPPLLLVTAVYSQPIFNSVSYPLDSIQRNLDWVHLSAYDYHLPTRERFALPHAALFDPASQNYTGFCITWLLTRGFPARKLDSSANAIGHPSVGPAVTADGSFGYRAIKSYVRDFGYGASPVYNGTYVVNLFRKGSVWINFDGVEAIRAKVTYAKEKGLLGYNVFQVGNDQNWVLSQTGVIRGFSSRLKTLVCKGESLDSGTPYLQTFSYATLKAANDDFSSQNKLGEGAFGPVCKSLGFDDADPIRKYSLDWVKRVHIIEGITQGLLFLQEYSNFTIIHRDLKASNVLLDDEMNPKISDFVWREYSRRMTLKQIPAEFGYVPPEYVRKGIYSMKYDIYSFGVLLLQIISGRRTSCYYGLNENLNLLDYAYEQWKDDKCMEFIDPSLDDSSSSCKLLRCMQVALLCVQEKPGDRPSMLEVYSMLKNESSAVNFPKKPAFSINKDEDEDGKCLLKEAVHSVNDASISELFPR